MQQPQQQAPQKPQEETLKSKVYEIKQLLPAVITGVASVSLIGVGIFLTATGNVAVGIPILSTVAGILLPSPVFSNSTKT